MGATTQCYAVGTAPPVGDGVVGVSTVLGSGVDSRTADGAGDVDSVGVTAAEGVVDAEVVGAGVAGGVAVVGLGEVASATVVAPASFAVAAGCRAADESAELFAPEFSGRIV